MRAFIVGNGESLRHMNLNNLTGEISFACNNIHLIYPFTEWRPTHYVRAEEASGLEPEHWLDSVKAHLALDCEIWCNDYFFRPRFGLQANDKVHTLKACAHYARHYDSPDTPHMLHLPVLCTFGSSVNVAVQIAMLQGFSPLYLIGCDLDGSMKHFTDEYRHGRERENRYAVMDTLNAHILAARSGYEIYNATKGGCLEVFERVDYEGLFA